MTTLIMLSTLVASSPALASGVLSAGVGVSPSSQVQGLLGTPAWSAGLTVGQDVVWMSARAGLGSIDDGNFRASGWLIRPQLGFNKYFKEKASPVRSYATASTYTLIGGVSQDQEVDFIARGSFLLGLTGGFGLEAQISERCSLAAEAGLDLFTVSLVSRNKSVDALGYETTYTMVSVRFWL